MAKHTPVAISGDDLAYRLETASASPWREVIGWNCAELDEAEWKATHEDTEANWKAVDALDNLERDKAFGGWWIVSWPEHVINVRYNSDANYCGPMTEAEARAYDPDAEIYGE